MNPTNRIMIRPILLLCMIAVLIFLPSFLLGPGMTHSYHYNYMWTRQFGDAMAAGDLYPRWLSDSFEGLGSPTFYFYPPIAYWISGSFQVLGLSTLQCVNMAGLLLVLSSGIAMYVWLKERGTAPLLGAALYMIAPYHLFDFYVRGALAELTVFVWLPLIALGISWLPGRRGIILLALAWGATMASHLPVALLTAIFLVAPLMLHRIMQDRAVLIPGAVAGLIGLALSAFYWLPAMTLQDHISVSILWGPGYLATEWTIWNSSFQLFPCLALGLIILCWKDRSIWTFITVFAALAAVRLIPFLWEITVLNKAQFPWRVMCVAEFAAITAMVSSRPRPIIWAMGGILLIFPYLMMGATTAGNLLRPVDYRHIDRIMPEPPEYLPAGFDLSRVRPGDHWTDVSATRALPRGDTITVKHAGPVTLHRAAFPIWIVERDGHPVASTGPLIHFDAQPGTYRIKRVRLWQENAGAALSALALLVLGLMLLRGRIDCISHLSKFRSYSPISALFDRPAFVWPGRSRQSGGEL